MKKIEIKNKSTYPKCICYGGCRRGLTLVEMIIAIAVLSVTMLASAAVSATYLKSRTSIKKYQANNEELSMVMNYLSKDIRMSNGTPANGSSNSIALISNASGKSVVYTFNNTAKTLTRNEDSAGAVAVANNVTGAFYVAGGGAIKRITIRMQKEGIPPMTVQTTVSMRNKYKEGT